MVRMITHAEAEELLGAYALDAVDPEEAEQVEAHLEVCPRCRDELRNHREVVGVLAYAGHEAPAGLWDRVLAGINTSGADGPADGLAPSLRLIRVDGDRTDSAAPVRLRRRVRIATAVAAAAAVVVALLGIQVVRLQNRTDHIDHQLQADSAGQPTMATVTAALDEPGAHSVTLRPLAGGGASVDAVVLPSGQGYLYDSRLTPLSAAQTYQLWGLVGAQKISYGIIGSVPPQVLAFRTGPGVDALAVTAEVAGGVPVTTRAPVVFGSVD